MNKLHWGTNCIDYVEGLKLLKDESIDLTVTSPPYDNLRTYNGYCFDFESVAKELYRVTKLGGVVVWVVGDATVKGLKLVHLLSKHCILKKLVLICMTL